MNDETYFTNEVLAELPALYANEGKKAEDVNVPLKLFCPWGAATWWITEYDPVAREAFGFVTLGLGPDCDELGYISIAELEEIRGPGGLRVERDLDWNSKTKLADVIAGKVR